MFYPVYPTHNLLFAHELCPRGFTGPPGRRLPFRSVAVDAIQQAMPHLTHFTYACLCSRSRSSVPRKLVDLLYSWFFCV